MKRLLIALYILLATTWNVGAQARFSADTEHIRFGEVAWKEPVTAQYTITNTGNQPLVLSDVEPDCACTIADWTQQPIAPGATGTVSVTFDAEALGSFHKSVAVMTNAEPHLVYLSIEGKVVRHLKDFTRTHPYVYGDVRIDRTDLHFPDTHLGTHPVLKIAVVNLSEQPYAPVLMHLPAYLKAVASPTLLQQNERGVILLELDTEQVGDYGLTQTSVYLSRFAGDKVGEENELPFSVVLLPDFSDLSQAQRAQAPRIELSATELDFSALLAKKSKARQDILLTNTGKMPFRISKLQVSHPALGVDLKKSVLQPGESIPMRITVVKKHLDKSNQPLRLLMITNDPEQPKIEIDIKR